MNWVHNNLGALMSCLNYPSALAILLSAQRLIPEACKVLPALRSCHSVCLEDANALQALLTNVSNVTCGFCFVGD